MDFPHGIPIIDADTHLTEVPDLWTARVPSKLREYAPYVDVHPQTGQRRWRLGDTWLAGDTGFSRIPGEQDERSFPASWADVDPACYDNKARLAWMDAHGMAAQVIYPNFLAFEGHAVMALKDLTVQVGLIQTYNDYLAEFASIAPNRFILLCSLPFWNIDASIAEMRRCKAMGFKGVLWAATMNRHKLPQFYDTYWDRFYAEAQELGMSINFHVGVGYTEDDSNAAIQKSVEPDPRDLTYRTAIGFQSNARTIAKLILFEVCERFPRLNFVSVESGFGFVPFLIEALDWQWTHVDGPEKRPDMLLPSEYFRRQIFSMFWFETGTLSQLPDWADNTMFETDFPHNTSLVPDSRLSPDPATLAGQHVDRFGPEIMSKVLSGNAARVYDVDLSAFTKTAVLL
jgi:predicted TIM-barrel fold metal-dependent hydrolase